MTILELIQNPQMLFFSTNPADDLSRSFIYHFPSHTLMEVFFGVGPGGSHHLRGHQQEGEIPMDALEAVRAWLESTLKGSSAAMTTLSNGQGGDLPEYLILASTSGKSKALIIHYPAVGFTAGLQDDGTKIPPYWHHPDAVPKERKSKILDHAADTLMRAIADYRQL